MTTTSGAGGPRPRGALAGGLTFEQLMVALLFGALATTALLVPAQSDSYWHLRAGQELWSTFRVTMDEHYSYTAAGRAWPNHEWLWQALSYALMRAGGWPLLTAASGAAGMAAFAVVYRLMVGPPRTRFVLMLLGAPLVPCVWAVRPQIGSLLLFTLTLRLLARGKLGWLPLLFMLWANLHGAVALGVVLVLAAAGAALWRARGGDIHDRARAWTFAIVTPLAILATAATPIGFGLWRYIAESTTLSKNTRISEWMPAYPTGPVEIGFWLLAIGFVVLVFRRRRALARAGWSDLVLVVAALVMLPLAIRAVRNIPLFLLAAMPAASRLLGLGGGLGRTAARAAGHAVGDDRPRLNAALFLGAMLAELVVVAIAWATPLPRLGWRPIAPAVLEAVRRCPGPIYNRYYDGGYLIWLAPEVRVFVDSRQDPYPLPFMMEQIALEAGAPYRPTFDRYGIRCALLPADMPLAARLGNEGWRTSFTDGRWLVLTAPPSHAP